jgi:hypothetical protein
MAEGITRTTRIRTEGTRILTAALESGARRLIAQSLACWVYADGPQPYSESDPLDFAATDRTPLSWKALWRLSD